MYVEGLPYAVVIDGRCLFDRAWYASRNALELIEGSPSHLVAAGAAIASLAPLLGPRGRLPHEPSHLLFCWDGLKAKSNKNRDARAGDHIPDLAYFRSILPELVGGTFYEPPDGVFGESDDAVATAVDRYSDDFNFCVVSTDKDLQQLARDADYYNLAGQMTLDEAAIKKRWGACRPSHVALYLALVGDEIDGIDGVAGIGKKRAIDILQCLGDIPMVDAISLIVQKLKPGQVPQFMTALELTVLVRDMPSVPSPGAIDIRGLDYLDELGIPGDSRNVWRSLLGRMSSGLPQSRTLARKGDDLEC